MSVLDKIFGAVKFSVESPCVEAEAKTSDGELYNMAVSEAYPAIKDAYCKDAGAAFIRGWHTSDFRMLKCGINGRKMKMNVIFRKDGEVECSLTGTIYANAGGKMTEQTSRKNQSRK